MLLLVVQVAVQVVAEQSLAHTLVLLEQVVKVLVVVIVLLLVHIQIVEAVAVEVLLLLALIQLETLELLVVLAGQQI
jgi:hypothetical protein